MKTTIDMAREAGCIPVRHPEYDNDVQVFATPDVLKAFEALVRADEREEFQRWFDAVTAQHKQEILAEREACAKVCDELVPDMSRTANDASVWDVATFDCAIAIRNRGNP
jgi:hypothetical protein